ncbi:hypothetical protein NG42_05015 [Winslowiella iniecta]|uniref:Surface presentation of antigen domain-containing protein n=2 Tax=Winslowiella iniecta TaxID=1560201 RepID=A0A0L7T8S3_9GAMM|nr:hypothetical protein NG42_05015 [Winslowiella iniecta]KOC94448.1 hypothetical protein NG43_04490 [Winslowiella iniecta]
MAADFRPPDRSSDAGCGNGLDEQLKKAKKEHYPEAIPLASLMPPLPRMLAEPPPAALHFVHHAALKVKTDFQAGNSQLPPQSVTPASVLMQQAALPLPLPLPMSVPVVRGSVPPEAQLPPHSTMLVRDALSLPRNISPVVAPTPISPVVSSPAPAFYPEHSARLRRDAPSVTHNISPLPEPHEVNSPAPAPLTREGLAAPGGTVLLSNNAPTARPLDKARREESSTVPSPAMSPARQSGEGWVAKDPLLKPKRGSQPLPAEAHARQIKSVPVAEGQNRISYSFSSWGSQHRVVLTSVRDSSQQLSVIMTPSDALVSHRLQHAIITRPPVTEMTLWEDRAGDGQQQERDKQPPEVDEE